MFQKHVHHYQNQVNELKRENEELEQYGRRLCVRVDGIPLVENDKFDQILDKVMSLTIIIRNGRIVWKVVWIKYYLRLNLSSQRY